MYKSNDYLWIMLPCECEGMVRFYSINISWYFMENDWKGPFGLQKLKYVNNGIDGFNYIPVVVFLPSVHYLMW